MCGIVGAVSSRDVAPLLLDSLNRLAYRGYDSAGIATLVNGRIERRRAEGKLQRLEQALHNAPLAGSIGIGHTRWATHGAPTEHNAHPHCTARVSVVHNGIIENHRELRQELEDAGQEFSTETDTEAVAQLLDFNLRQGMTPIEAVDAALPRLSGSYALAIIFSGYPDLIVAVQHGAPLAVGFGEDEMFVGSDGLALIGLTRRIAHLIDGDWAVMDRRNVHIFDAEGRAVLREIAQSGLDAAATSKGNFAHYMAKELHEHPLVLRDTLAAMIDPASRAVALPALPFDLAALPQISISACGSAFYAGLVGRWWLESVARIQTGADVASEFRYRAPPLSGGGLGLLVSQSGETADTLAALHYMRAQQQHVLAIVNVPESSIARASDAVLKTRAGPEMSVASTKAFSAQLALLACLAIAIGRARGTLTPDGAMALVAALLALPDQAQMVLAGDAAIQALAPRIARARDVLFLGRGNCYPIALEGALKLKELSYIHAEGYAAGEMKHGPIALIDTLVPVLAIIPSGPLFEKTASNLQEAAARGGQIVAFTDAEGAIKLHNIATETIVLPTVDPFVAPILYAIAVQMLAYHVAVLLGTDVDQPRNLAKSVTVE
jgi:glucosamine--fructose-6-phosphate aminotransferase (isomerizing)